MPNAGGGAFAALGAFAVLGARRTGARTALTPTSIIATVTAVIIRVVIIVPASQVSRSVALRTGLRGDD